MARRVAVRDLPQFLFIRAQLRTFNSLCFKSLRRPHSVGLARDRRAVHIELVVDLELVLLYLIRRGVAILVEVF